LQLEVDAKVDFKVKAKQFVKIYGQMASIMPFEVVDWEKLFWFLKFLIPKLKIDDPTLPIRLTHTATICSVLLWAGRAVDWR
jgi:hypothetical protein